MGRIFTVRINLDDMCAGLDALESPQESHDWLKGFRIGSRGHPGKDEWSVAMTAGYLFGLDAYAGACAFSEKQSAKGKRSAQQRFNHGSTTVQPNVNHGSTISNIQYPVSNIQLSKIQGGNTNFLDTPEDEVQLAKPLPPPSKPPSRHLPDFLAICPGMHVSRDNRPDWDATLKHWGWEALVDGATTLRKQKNGQPVYHNEMTDWLANNYESDDA